MKEAATFHQMFGWGFDVQDAIAGRPVLGAAIENRSATTMVVLVQELSVDQIGERFESTVRVPRCSLGLTRCVLHFAHLIHMNEGVKVDRVDAGKGAADRETLALISLGCVGHRLDGAQGGCGVHAQARKGHGVCGDSRHEASLVVSNLRFN